MALVKCTECGNEISNKALACPKCGAPVNYSEREEHRAAVTQADFNKSMWGIFSFQVLIIAIYAGLHNSSWPVFLGVFLGLLMISTIPLIGKIFGVALAVGVGVVGLNIGSEVVGILFFLISLGANLSASDYMNDISKN